MYDSSSYLIAFTGDVLVVLDLVIDESQLKTGAAREVFLRNALSVSDITVSLFWYLFLIVCAITLDC